MPYVYRVRNNPHIDDGVDPEDDVDYYVWPYELAQVFELGEGSMELAISEWYEEHGEYPNADERRTWNGNYVTILWWDG